MGVIWVEEDCKVGESTKGGAHTSPAALLAVAVSRTKETRLRVERNLIDAIELVVEWVKKGRVTSDPVATAGHAVERDKADADAREFREPCVRRRSRRQPSSGRHIDRT